MTSVLRIALTIVLFAAVQAPSWARNIHPEEVEYQTKAFKHWWQTDLIWRFDDLPKLGMVEKHRVPYAGFIYPDNNGGTGAVLRKYDRAFHYGRPRASSFERRDIAMHQETTQRPGPLFGFFTFTVRATPHWAGHCNGWTAAAIRHAEPQRSVIRNGVRFTPADIKGLLAELYVYSDTEFLGGVDAAVNPGTLHVVLANWLGRGQHPIGMDSSVGHEVWNYPIYAYNSSARKRGPRQVEVKMNLGYIYMLDQEYHRAPVNYRFMYLHYMLDLNHKGEITGGYYLSDSNRIDMLWAPLKPVQGGKKGNEQGNPYLDVDEVLAMWRESAPASLRSKWWNIDPTEEDRLPEPEPEAVPAPESLATEEAEATDEQISRRDLVEQAAEIVNSLEERSSEPVSSDAAE